MTLVKWPTLNDDDVAAVTSVMERGILVKGPMAPQLEEAFGNYIGVSYCRAVSSCTHAIHLALRTLGIGPGDEVLVPNLTYCGTVSPVVNCGATPVFVDVNEADYNISVANAREKRTSRTKAVIPVHLHGYPCDLATIREALPDLPIVEDACQAHGAMRNGQYAGSWGTLSCFSLNQVKPLCGGQGGLVVTSSPLIWDRLSDLASPGQNRTVGLSYEITELSAAIALTQLNRLEDILDVANRNYRAFCAYLAEKHRHIVQGCEDGVRPTWHKLRLRVPEPTRERLISSLERASIPYETWPGTLVSQRTEYHAFPASTPISERILSSSLVLGNEMYPFHAQRQNTIEHWAAVINEALNSEGRAPQ